jgi:hypothetical protein
VTATSQPCDGPTDREHVTLDVTIAVDPVAPAAITRMRAVCSRRPWRFGLRLEIAWRANDVDSAGADLCDSSKRLRYLLAFVSLHGDSFDAVATSGDRVADENQRPSWSVFSWICLKVSRRR